MRSLTTLFTAAALLLEAAAPVTASSHGLDLFSRANKRAPALQRKAPMSPAPRLDRRAPSKYLNNRTASYAVSGTGIPDVPFDIGESYAGLLPISSAPNETRQLYFWFFPSSNVNASTEVAAWFNGGPGCSSLSGLLTENGPFTWESGTLSPVLNPYTWVNLTNMVWIEQPVGVGFTQGTPNITDEVQLAVELAGFWHNFIDLFDMQKYDMYLTGESYAGYYVPYIADEFISRNDTDYFNLKGIAINDPIIGDGTNQQETIIVPYVEYWNNLFDLNSTFMSALQGRADACGFTAYMSKYFAFPPPGPLPLLPNPFNDPNFTCDVFDDVYSAVLEVNPCFNIYHITDTCPHPYSQLGIVNQGDYEPPNGQVYFNRTDVQKAINAPVGTNWMQCTNVDVFGNGTSQGQDASVGPAQDGVLQRVIEHTNNTIIGSGNLDMLLSTNGTLLAIQNMTWNGLQGLQKYPGADFFVPYHPEYNGGALGAAGVVGSWGTERGLTFYQVQLAGHELPGYAPTAGYRALEKLLGRIPDLGTPGDFTTQSGNFTGTSTIYKSAFRGIGRRPW